MLAPALVFILPLLFPAPWISIVHAQTTDAICLPAYSWMNNSMGQNPCLVTAWLFGPCYSTGIEIPALQTGSMYGGPLSPAGSTNCRCNTVVYSLLAACAICQTGAARIETWPIYTTNCTQSYNESYHNTIPGGTSVPEWAFLDVIGNAGNFDLNEAKSIAAQHLPDVTATTDTSSTSTLSSRTSASSATPTSDSTGASSQNLIPSNSPVTKHSRKHMGAIVGGVVGAVVGASVLLVGAVVFRILRYQRQRRRDQGVANAVPTTEVRELLPDSTAPSYHVPTLQNEVGSTIMGFYDPNDPRTYPAPMDPVKGYTGRPQVMA